MKNKKYPTFRSTITKSKEWREWEKVALKKGWDWAESTECGWLSPEHFTAFLNFVRYKALKKQQNIINELGEEAKEKKLAEVE